MVPKKKLQRQCRRWSESGVFLDEGAGYTSPRPNQPARLRRAVV